MRLKTLAAFACGLLITACSSTPGYDEHAGQVMTRVAEGRPLPAEESIGAPPHEAQKPLLPPARELPGEAAPPEMPAPGGANPPDFLKPTPERQSPLVETQLTRDEGQALTPGGTAAMRFSITPLVEAAEVQVRYEIDGPATATPESSNAGAVPAQRPLLTNTSVTLQEGRSVLKATVEGRDAQGAAVYTRSERYFFIVEQGKVLAGPGGFLALDKLELERQRDAGEITPEDFKTRMRILQEAPPAQE